MTWITIDTVQRVVTPKAGNSELRFFMFCRLYHGDIHLHKVSRISQTVFKLQWTQIYYRNHYFQSSKGLTQKVGQPVLQFLCSAPRLMMLYICVKFHQNIWNGLQLTEQTRVHSRNGYFQYLCSKGCNSKSRLTRVTVFVLCMLYHGALHL